MIRELSSYLADYIDHECIVSRPANKVLTTTEIHELIKQGIEAYESTENCQIVVFGGDCPDCQTLMVTKTKYLWDEDGNRIEFGIYECPECAYLTYG